MCSPQITRGIMYLILTKERTKQLFVSSKCWRLIEEFNLLLMRLNFENRPGEVTSPKQFHAPREEIANAWAENGITICACRGKMFKGFLEYIPIPDKRRIDAILQNR